MKKTLIKTLLFGALLAISGCANSDTYSVPTEPLVTYDLTPTKTVQDIVLIANASPNPTLYTANDIIEAYVTSSDEGGNFYKSVSFQTIPTDGSNPIGFSVPINITSLFAEGFNPGRKIYIKLNGLYVANVYGSLQIGSLYEGTIGRIAENIWQNHLFPSAEVKPESSFVTTMTVAQAFTDANQNRLIELDPVQFAESSLGRTYYDVDSGGGATNHTVVSTTGGTGQVIRFSSFAPFTGKMVPTGSGKIRGVLTKYQTTYQFMVRNETDIKLTGARVDLNPAIGGSAVQYLGSFSENFESFSASTSPLNSPKYINDAFLGTKYWAVESFSSNKYLKFSAFSSSTSFQEQNNKVYFIVPVDFTAANSFSFKTQDRFNVGNVLKVYLSTNYVPNGNIANATLTNITNSFTIASGTTGSASQPFVNSGLYNIPSSLTGNGFIIFEYTGGYSFNPDLTTTMHLDDIVVN
jgi:hypothetical protein